MNKYCLVFIVFFLSTKLFSQVREFRSLKEALAFSKPDSVFVLDLSNQDLGIFPLDILNFRNLQRLSLRNDHLRAIPDEINFLKNLKVLDLGGNDFSVLPKRFSSLGMLEEFFLDNNSHLSLEENIEIISKLPNLKSLHLENNHLQKVPSNFKKLKKIERLYLFDNDFKYGPKEILGLKNLKNIDFRKNPISKNKDFYKVENHGIKIMW